MNRYSLVECNTVPNRCSVQSIKLFPRCLQSLSLHEKSCGETRSPVQSTPPNMVSEQIRYARYAQICRKHHPSSKQHERASCSSQQGTSVLPIRFSLPPSRWPTTILVQCIIKHPAPPQTCGGDAETLLMIFSVTDKHPSAFQIHGLSFGRSL